MCADDSATGAFALRQDYWLGYSVPVQYVVFCDVMLHNPVPAAQSGST
jgi:hypothetical protein